MGDLRRPHDLPRRVIDDGNARGLAAGIKLHPQGLRLSIRLPVFQDDGEGVAPQDGGMPRAQQKARPTRMHRIE